MLKKSYSNSKPLCKVTFSLPLEAARGGKDVRILGDFNHWSWENGYRMTAGKTEFTTEVELTSGREYQFRYLIDNHIWENDWKADRYTPAAYGEFNSVLSLIAEKPAKKESPVITEKKTVSKPDTQKVSSASKPEPVAAKPAEKKVVASKPAAKPVAKMEAKPKAAPKTTKK